MENGAKAAGVFSGTLPIVNATNNQKHSDPNLRLPKSEGVSRVAGWEDKETERKEKGDRREREGRGNKLPAVTSYNTDRKGERKDLVGTSSVVVI